MSKVLMSHGAGGDKMRQMLEKFILPKLRSDVGDVPLSALDDSGIIDDIVFTIDGHTVTPLFFPGGDMQACRRRNALYRLETKPGSKDFG